MSNIAFTILLLIMIALIVIDALCVKQIRDLTRDIRACQSLIDEIAGIKAKSKALDSVVAELAHAINTLSAQEAVLNTKTATMNIRMEQMKRSIKTLNDDGKEGTEHEKENS